MPGYIELCKTEKESETLNREKRGLINPVGKIYKLLFRIMDNDDHEEIMEHLMVIDTNNHNLIKLLNNQLQIKNVFQNNLNKIVENINHTNSSFKTLASDINNTTYHINKILVEIQLNHSLDLIKDELEKLIDNVNSARTGIVSRSILTYDEIDTYNLSIDELKDITTNVLIKSNILIFVINIPILTQPILSYYVSQVPNKYHQTLNIDIKNVVLYNNKYFKFEKHVKSLKNTLPCKNKNCIIEYKNNNQVSEIEKGLLLVIDVNEKLKQNCNEKLYELNGIFVIRFSNCNIEINEKVYTNNVKQFQQILMLEPIKNISNYNIKINMEQLKIENINNLEKIEEIKFVHKQNIIATSTIIIIIIIILTVLFIAYLYFKNNKSIKININESRREDIEKEGGVTYTPTHITTNFSNDI
ncbi:uncharacterized protein LOC119647163 [Hermetia illucens]|uniref:uncharacterized protein LOC119647163 n=1 Tax=Hermetia illucens TaxID=343691 RepID=UPI0018CC4A6D|nr:uncharacterized protein LOC119647163 [Hermetia illucens]